MPRHRPNPYLAALRRITAEGPVPIADLAGELGACACTVVRWITRGKGGVKLEGFESCRLGWVTSRPAAARFLDALRERKQKRDAA